MSTGLSREERKGTSIKLNPDDPPPDLRALWEKLPPRIKLKEGCKVRQISRARMYQRIKSGHIIASKGDLFGERNSDPTKPEPVYMTPWLPPQTCTGIVATTIKVGR